MRNRDSLVLGKPEPLFDLEVPGPEGPLMYPTSSDAGPAYDVLPDGRFVIARGPDSNRASEIVLVLNFFEELKRLKAAD